MPATILFPLLALAASFQAAPPADKPIVTCPATVAPPPAGLEGWVHMRPVRAGRTVHAATVLPLGTGTTASLLPTPEVDYALPPAKPSDAASSGGLFAFTVPVAGLYRVALGAGAWIDVLRDGAPVPSTAHGHGPDCSGIRKMVDFDLKPGRYLLQVAGSRPAIVPLMVARTP